MNTTIKITKKKEGWNDAAILDVEFKKGIN